MTQPAPPQTENGNHLTKGEFRWVMGLLITMILTLVSFMIQKFGTIDNAIAEQGKDVSALQADNFTSKKQNDDLTKEFRDQVKTINQGQQEIYKSMIELLGKLSKTQILQ